VKIMWLGHASFLIQSPGVLRILTDPFGDDVPYPKIDEVVDVVTVSHDHHDHNAVHVLKGEFVALNGLDKNTGKCLEVTKHIGDVTFRTVPSYHDDKSGGSRGENAIFVMDFGGFTIVHLGDLGHALSPKQVEQIGAVNMLMIPVGGHYTIDAPTAKVVVEQLNPNVVLPMHYKTKYLESWPISTVDAFLEGQSNVVRFDSNEVEFEIDDILDKWEIWVFEI